MPNFCRVKSGPPKWHQPFRIFFTFFAFLLIVVMAAARQSQGPPVTEIFHEFDRIAAQLVWPGFDPRSTAIEVFDGSNTFLLQHPKPPEGFRAVEGEPRIYVFSGQHETVRANTGTEVNGVATATADISKDARQSIPELASLLIHETFHVYEKKEHPKWAANEVELFTYPVEDAGLLLQRRLETLALVRALQARNNDQHARCWAGAALAERKERFGKMPAGAAAYERGTELNEGLAQYVEYKLIGKAAALTPADFPVDKIRERGYATGQALALLLDRFVGNWKSTVGDTPLDELLLARMPRPSKVCSFDQNENNAQFQRAKQDLEQLVAARERHKQEFLNAAGWRIEVLAGNEPLWPQGFDPWNVENVGKKEVLHSRWLKLGNGSGSIEVLNHGALTEGAGKHPLFNGVRKLAVTGLAEPKLTEKDGKVTIDVPGAKATFTGTVEQSGTTISIKVH